MRNFIVSIAIVVVAGAAIYAFIKDKRESADMQGETNEMQQMSFFVTSANPGEGGNLGGLEGADQYCATLAEAAGVTGKTWRAYLSATATGTNSVIHARDRIGQGPWHNARGERIASSITELHSDTNNLNKNTALTEQGEMIMGRGDEQNLHDILTGSSMDGYASTTAQTDTTCGNWTSSNEGSAVVGHHDRVGINDSAAMRSWNSSHATRGCSMEALESTGGGGLFYCFAE